MKIYIFEEVQNIHFGIGVHILLIYLFILFSMLSFYLKCVLIGICMESKDLFLLTNAN